VTVTDCEPAGRTALVTGGGTGIGRAVALALGRAGARVGILGRRPDPIGRVAAELASSGGEALAVPCDVTNDAQLEKACGMVAASLGPIEILVHCAGAAWSGPLVRLDDETMDRLLRLNLRSAFVLARLLTPAMRRQGYGRIVHLASTAALRGYRYTAAYTASKHALASLCRSLSAELLPHGITVNALCPGFVDTPLVDEAVNTIAEKTGGTPEEARATLAAQNPLGRLVRPEEVARAALYLVGPDSGAVSGHSLVLDGGTQPV